MGDSSAVPIRSRWVGDREYEQVPTPYWCSACGEQGLPSMRDGDVCLLCGEQDFDASSFRVGWDR